MDEEEEKNRIELKRKQDILTEKIINGHYDRQQFIYFLLEKKEDIGDDLNNQSFSELKEEIEEFTKSHKPVEHQKGNDTQISNNSQTDNESQNRNNSISVFLNQNGVNNSNIPKKKSCCPCQD